KASLKTTRKPSDPTSAAVEFVPLQLDPEALVPSRSVRPLGKFSLSPWTYNVTQDDSLFPPGLAEARCSLRGCRDAQGGEDLSLESKPIMHQALLLRRVAAAGGRSYHYRLETRLVSVGCTCVRPGVLRQD
ncbi:interleukin-17F-like, partial [Centroberyx gerrardi]